MLRTPHLHLPRWPFHLGKGSSTASATPTFAPVVGHERKVRAQASATSDTVRTFRWDRLVFATFLLIVLMALAVFGTPFFPR